MKKYYYDKEKKSFNSKQTGDLIEIEIDELSPPDWTVKNENGTFKGFYPKSHYNGVDKNNLPLLKTDAELAEYNNFVEKDRLKAEIIALQLKITAGELNELDMKEENTEIKELNKIYKELG